MLIGYARVSTADRQSLDMQIDALTAAGVDRRHLYQDKASGAVSDRPGLIKALSDCQPGDSLVVWKLDRIGRSLPHFLAVLDDLKARGVHLVSVTEKVDTCTPQGQLFLQVAAVFAEYERSMATERVNAGLAAAAKRGRRGGRPKVISDEQMAYIRNDLRTMSKADVCRKYNLKRSTLFKSLGRSADAGELVDQVDQVHAGDVVDIEELIP